MKDIILETNQLTKHFGNIKAVNDLDLRIERGVIFGMLGPNGSGKTTTLGMLMGVTKPSSGSYSWFGRGTSHEIRKDIGAILEHPVFYPYMSGYQNLELTCLIKGVDKKKIDEVLETVGLINRKNDRFKTYSLGMKQRLAIASALLSDPSVLVLDEPTNGLDPQGIFDVRELIREIAGTDKSIILASHLLDEVQKVCSDFCVLREGNLIHQGSVEEDFSDDVKIEIAAEDNQKLAEILGAIPEIKEVLEKSGKLIIRANAELKSLDINRILIEKGVVVHHLRTLQKSLEEQFMDILKENHA